MIICWDSAEVLKTIESESIDMVLTSPPYDNLRTYNWFVFDFETIANELKRVLKPWGVIVWVVWDATVNGSETGTSFKQALYFKEIGLNLHDTMIWEKDTFSAVGALKSRYAPVTEYMFILSKWKPKTFNAIKDRKNLSAWSNQHWRNRQTDWTMKTNKKWWKVNELWQRFNIWRVPVAKSNIRWHPAIFPEQLAIDHIKSWSNEWDVILDPFAWSWTTLKAAKLLNRNYIGIEISQEYVDIATERLANYQNTLL